MGRGVVAAVALSVTVASGAVLATVAMVAGSSPATASSPSASPVVAILPATTSASGPARTSASPSTKGTGASIAPAPSPSIDPRTVSAGLDGGYRFVAHLNGLPGLMSLGPVVAGTVRDPDHFVLEFPDSTFITRYTRHGATADAFVDGRRVTVHPGVGTLGDISPEDLMPGRLWAQAVEAWGTALVADAPGRYAADVAALVSHARQAGINASNWQITAQTDPAGRLLTLAFSGAAWDQPFSLDLVVQYG